jgi:hypothetical protein
MRGKRVLDIGAYDGFFTLQTNGGDATFIFVQHPWSGGANISINGGPPTYIDLYSEVGTIKDYRIPTPRNLSDLKTLKAHLPLNGTQTLRWHVSAIPSNLRIQSIRVSGLREWQWNAGDITPRAGIGVKVIENTSDGLIISNSNATSGWLEWSGLPPLPNTPGSAEEQRFILLICLSLWGILLLGLRNPFRFGVSDTNMVLIVDVGSAPPLGREEINLGTPGANYGWPDSEGITNDSKFVSPIYSYEHDNACNSIIGGTFVRDGYGPTYANNYVFGDFSCGSIWFMTVDQQGNVSHIVRAVNDIKQHPVHFEVGRDGLIYYADISGTIWRIVPQSPL